MMKYAPVYALLFLFIFCTAWKGQNKTGLPAYPSKSEIKDVISSHGLTNRTSTRANFSGEWKLNESKSERVGQFPLCIFGGGDRMRSKIMKIAGHVDFLTIDVASSSVDGSLVTRQEKLIFDGKESKATFVGSPREISMAKWSDDGQTMTINSVRFLDSNREKADFKVTEVWTLINDGKSISVQVNSSSTSRENTMKLVYDKQLAANYRF
ncbi:hypothetical protein [Spirosoma endbachense]|uniref:Uncharacterized protein n=1 Tax=Spirosoma endbachense TaxID=2666025 RepID=A0A6P1W8Q6_9BACT|nr:hypothetical protein [Spirosoma endbachense]QHW00301.1 hypothetical protein GJR95_37090 [Spirosoma endbachense]